MGRIKAHRWGRYLYAGDGGPGFYFDGLGSYIRIPNDDALDFPNELTIELWYKHEGLPTDSYGLVSARGTDVQPVNYAISVIPIGIGPYFNDPMVASGDDAEYGSAFEASRYVPIPSPGVFHHLGVTFRQASPTEVELKTFIDGTLVRAKLLAARLANGLNDTAIVIGRSNEDGQEWFKGVIDEVGIYNRALTADEIQGIVHSGVAGKCRPAEPPPPYQSYDLSRDFSPTHNPNGVWSYGYETTLGEAFTLLTFPLTSVADNPVPVDSWSKNGYEPVAVYHNGTTNTSISDGGAGVFPPGTTWFYPGVEGHADNYGVIRFTVPVGGAGTYRLQTEVRAYLDGPRSGDTDFHVLRNGVELFGEFVPGNSGTSYSNRLSLAEGERIDFAVGRGQDNVAFDSGLKIRATIALVSAPPPPPPPTHDLSRDFSSTHNPNGTWSYGYLTELNGSFGLVSAPRIFSSDNGVPIAAWELNTYEIPGVWKVLGPGTAHSDGDHFTAEPGTVYFAPGADGAPQNFGAIRFTLPRGAGGAYRLETTVRSLFDYARSRDADFHVLKNGRELFGHFLSPNSAASYSNIIALEPGDIVDFAIGRGADGLTADTGLKIQATLTFVTNAPPPPGPCTAPAPGIVAWWRAEGNPNDFVGTNRGELFGGTSYATGKVGRAFALSGGSSGVRIPAGPGLNVGAGPGLTIEGWIRPTDLSIRGPLVEWNRGGSNIIAWGVHLYILRPDEFGLGAGNLVANLAESGGQPHLIMAPGGTVSVNHWQHVALTYDKDSGQTRLYRNGEIVAESILGTFTPETSYDLYLGRRPAGDAILSYRGLLDEFAIYNRALSAVEIEAIARAGAAGNAALRRRSRNSSSSWKTSLHPLPRNRCSPFSLEHATRSSLEILSRPSTSFRIFRRRCAPGSVP
jgi:hypothetical protein